MHSTKSTDPFGQHSESSPEYFRIEVFEEIRWLWVVAGFDGIDRRLGIRRDKFIDLVRAQRF